MGLRRMKARTFSWRFMQRYEAMKKSKGSGKAIIATARKMATVIWNMLTEDVEFDIGLMVDQKLAKKSEQMGGLSLTKEALIEEEADPTSLLAKDALIAAQKKPLTRQKKSNGEKNLALPEKKEKKLAKR